MSGDSKMTLAVSFDLKKCGAVLVLLGMIAIAAARNWTVPSMIILALGVITIIALFLAGQAGAQTLLCLVTAYLPFSKKLAGLLHYSDFTILFNLLLAGVTFVIFLFMGDNGKKKTPLAFTLTDIAIGLFLLLQILSIAGGFWYGTDYLWKASLAWIEGWATPLFFYFLVRHFVPDHKTLKTLVVTAMMSVAAAAVLGNLEYAGLSDVTSFDKKRIGGIVLEPNMFASFLNFYMYFFLGFLITYWKKWQVWPVLIPLMLAVRALIVTYSRGGYLAFAAGLYALTFFKNKILFAVLIAGSLLLALNPSYLPEPVRNRFSMTFEEKSGGTSLDRSSEDRIHVWRGAVRMIAMHPVSGAGFNLFESKIPPFWAGARKFNAHNGFLMIAAETGIPSILIFLFVIFEIVRRIYRLHQQTSDLFVKAACLGLMSGLTAFLLNNFYIDSISWQDVSLYFWIIAGVLLKIESESARKGVAV